MPNVAPIADAGPDQPVKIRQDVTLDGSGSSDADGDPLSYAWTVISPPEAAGTGLLRGHTSVMPVIVPESHGTYVIELIVNDGKVNSKPDRVSLLVGNTPPVADAGEDQAISPEDKVILDGSGSTDLDQDQLTYKWSLVSAPAGADPQLSDNASVHPEFIARQAGSYTFSLVVNDGIDDSEPDFVTINTVNTAPVADAGNDQSVEVGSIANLDGSGSSDADGDALSYQWNLISRPNGSNASLNNDGSVTPSLTIDKAGSYIAQLIVSDGIENSAPDTVILTTANVRPVADAGNGDKVWVGESVQFDGSGSYDPDGDDLSYNWSIVSQPVGSNVALDGVTLVAPSTELSHAGSYVVQLVVNDGQIDSLPDTVNVEVAQQPVGCSVSGNSKTIPVVLRDFKRSHPDFEYRIADDRGIVESWLGEDGKPVYAHGSDGTKTTNGPSSFAQWYNNVEGVNIAIDKTLTMSHSDGSSIWTYENTNFFPVDGEGWGNTRNTDHNYHFTLETHLEFDYDGGEVFTFRGDDDLWLYINGMLVIDIGGVHGAQEQSVSLDDIADYIDIEVGETYSFDLFFAERHTVKSNFMFQTNIKLECVPD